MGQLGAGSWVERIGAALGLPLLVVLLTIATVPTLSLPATALTVLSLPVRERGLGAIRLGSVVRTSGATVLDAAVVTLLAAFDHLVCTTLLPPTRGAVLARCLR